MADTDIIEDSPAKRTKTPLVLGLILALALGGGGFFAVYSGLLLGTHAPAGEATHDAEPESEAPKVAFVPIDPLIINMGGGTSRQYLRFQAQLEVDPGHEAEVTAMLPRIIDVLNGYLRAVELRDLADPAALVRLRAQMLRRVQVVLGEGRVNDLLIMEFVVN